jgi:hypothetical protein
MKRRRSEIIHHLLTKSVLVVVSDSGTRPSVRFNEQYVWPRRLESFFFFFSAARCFLRQGKIATAVSSEKVYKPRIKIVYSKTSLLWWILHFAVRTTQRTASDRDRGNPVAWGMSGYSNCLESSLIDDIVEFIIRAARLGGHRSLSRTALQVRRELNNVCLLHQI